MNKTVLIACIFIFLFMNFASAEVIDRGASWNNYNNRTITIYSGEINYFNGTGWIPKSLAITPSTRSGYDYEMIDNYYKIYFNNNSNTAGALRFEKNGYFFTYDLSAGEMLWKSKPGQPDAWNTLGSGASSNSQNTQISISANKANYSGAFYNTSVVYSLYLGMLKEVFILGGLPSYKDYLYLEYSGNIKFNQSLDICANAVCYTPSGTQDDFETSGKIEFKNSSGATIFYLNEPTVVDSNGTKINATYRVHGSNAQMNFYLRINKTFLENAAYPIYIDPTIVIRGSDGADAYVFGGGVNQNYGSEINLIVKSGSGKRNSYLNFNISSIPSNQVIDNSLLCLYMYNDVGTNYNGVYHVYNGSIWTESTITWNNQPCGTNFDNDTNCNLTAESSLSNDGSLDNTWQCWNVTNMLNKNYINNLKEISMALYTADASNDEFYSKEYADSSLRPYLNVSYHTANVAPTISIVLPGNTTYNTIQTGLNYIASDSDGNLQACKYSLNSGLTNISITCGQNATGLSSSQGSNNWKVWANDSYGLESSSQITFFVDSIVPGISFSTGTKISGIYSNTNSIFANISTSDTNQRYSFINFNNSLILHYKMNETSGSLIDYSGNSQTAVNQDSNALYQQAGMFGKGIKFNENSWFKLGKDNINFTNNNFTISFWIKPGRFPTAGWTPLAKGTVASYNTPFVFYGVSAGQLRFYIANSLCTGWELDGNAQSFYTTATLNEWQLISVTKAGNNYSLYKNAVLIKNVVTSSDSICSNSAGYNMTIGGTRTGAQLINATMDEILIFNRAMSLNEVSALYSASEYSRNFTQLEPGTYNFYSYVQDISGNENSTETRTVSLAANSPPTISIVLPANTTYNTIQTGLSYIVSDSDGNLQACWYSLNSGLTNTTINCGQNATGLTSSQGSNTWKVWANDSYGLESSSQITFFVDSISPFVSISSPQNSSKSTNNQLTVNYTASDTNLQACWWNIDSGTNSTITCGNNITSQVWQEGSNTIIIYANDSLGNVNYSQITFFVDSISPLLSIVAPEDGTTYGINTSLQLNYTASDTNLQACWWNIDSGTNSTINCGQNTTFDTSSGSHIINIYANDSYGLQASSSASFTINLGAPTISGLNPGNVYLASSLVNFSYYVSDTDLQACELWGNFTGIFSLNQTNLNPVNNAYNNFSLVLPDGSYLWNIKCNDTSNHWAFNGNKTFNIDTALPVLTITEPTGTKTSRTGISLTFSASDRNPGTCWYNVYRGASIEIVNTTISCTTPGSFSVTVDADFILNLYANDSAGNSNSASSSFTVSTSIPPVTPPADGGGGGGGGSTVVGNATGKGKMEISGVSDVTMKPGESKTLDASVKNTGLKFLNNCRLTGGGQASSWISGKDTKGISPGESVNFVYTISVPLTASEDSAASIYITCDEASNSKDFKISIAQSSLKLEIKSSEHQGDRYNFVYIVTNGEEEQKTISAEYWIAGEDNIRIAEGKEEFNIGAGGSLERQVGLDLPAESAGEYVLNIKLSSDSASAYSQESILIGGTGGLAGRLLSAESGKIFAIILLCVVSLIVVIMIVRRIIKRPGKEENKGYVRLNLGKKSQKQDETKPEEKKADNKLGFFSRLKESIFRRKNNITGIPKKGVMIIDSQIVEHLKKHAEGKDLKGKWIHVKHHR